MSAADSVLILHAVFVLFVVTALPAIWLGAALGKGWARNPGFRGLHLAAIGFVVLQSLLGHTCPLTIWEDALRGTVTEKGFIARWVHAALYWDWPAWVFTSIYGAFGLLVAATWVWIPPRRKAPGA